MKLTDYLLIFGIIIILTATVFSVTFYFNYKEKECVSNPLVYGARQIKNTYDIPVYGKVIFLDPQGRESPTIEFNSTNLNISKMPLCKILFNKYSQPPLKA